MSHPDTLKKIDSPNVQASATKQGAWRWRWLVAPLMGISFILHLALLFLPIPAWNIAAEETVEEETPADAEEEPIDILSLADIAAPDPPPEQPPDPPQQQQQAPPPSGAVPPPPDPSQVIEEPIEEDVYEEEPLIDDEATENFDSGPATEEFLGDLSGLGVVDYTAEYGLPPPDYLRRPENASCFMTPDGNVVPGVRASNWLDKEPQTLLRENLQDVYGPKGITFAELDAFCGERYFQASTAEGQPFMTLSLVQLEGSTLLIVWETPPQ